VSNKNLGYYKSDFDIGTSKDPVSFSQAIEGNNYVK
jgi:hypothetical protein